MLTFYSTVARRSKNTSKPTTISVPRPMPHLTSTSTPRCLRVRSLASLRGQRGLRVQRSLRRRGMLSRRPLPRPRNPRRPSQQLQRYYPFGSHAARCHVASSLIFRIEGEACPKEGFHNRDHDHDQERESSCDQDRDQDQGQLCKAA